MTCEPERYEQGEGPAYRFVPGRRDFLRALGGGLCILITGPAGAEPARLRGGSGAEAEAERVSAWLRIGPDGAITVFSGKVEVGQQIRTALAQIVAEELEVSLDRVVLILGDTALTPHDRGTHGSQSIPRMGAKLRQAAATARRLLIDLAAEAWKHDAKALVARDGHVMDLQGGRQLGYGELAGRRDLAAEVVDARATVEPPARWGIAGRSVPSVDGRAVVTGAVRFVSDLRLDRMGHGRVLRAPSWGAELVEVDVSQAAALPGVTVVRDGGFVGVVADDVGGARRAVERLAARWHERGGPSSVELFDHLLGHPVERQGWGGRAERVRGNFARAHAGARTKLRARYTLPYVAHVPLEPRAAVARWTADGLEVWVGTQHPFPVRDELAAAFGLDPARVRVRVPATGSGYGGKHTSEWAIEAARLAKGAKRPVKLIWTREEEFQWAYFRPAGVIQIESGVDRRGRLVAWQQENHNSGSSGLVTPYAVPHERAVFQPTDSPARQGSYRALAATANHFAREVHMDELAHALGVDPLAFRRRQLDHERLAAVLEAAAARFAWSERRPRGAGRGSGMALGTEKDGFVATFAEVEVAPDRTLRVVRVVTAFDCGAVVNPDNLRNQIEGAVIMGLGGALFEAIELDRGRATNPRLSRYRVPRFSDVPVLETVLVDRRDQPSAGAGETPIVGVAPAIANAIFDAVGQRIRDLPLSPGGKLRSPSA